MSYQFAKYFKYKDRELEMLYAIFKACSFEDVCDDIPDRKNAANEAKKNKQLEERLSAFYETKI